MKHRILTACGLLAFALVTGCSSDREVKVSGKITADPGLDTHAAVRLDFYDAQEQADAGEAKLELVDSVSLDAVGDFEHTLSVQGKTVHVVAFLDSDESESCTDGEAWGEADVDVADVDTADVAVRIAAHTTCPKVPAAE